MFNRFKSALYNVVGNFDPLEGGTVGNIGTVSLASGVQNIPSVIRQSSIPGKEKTVKFPYTRPHFLQLNSEDEILVTADHALRPIICPRDITRLPWNSGYAETINAGKSKKNEDQSAVHVGLLTRCIPRPKLVSDDVMKSKRNESKNGSSSVNGLAEKTEVNGLEPDGIVSVDDDSPSLTSVSDQPSKRSPQQTEATSQNSFSSHNLKYLKSEKREIDHSVVSLPYYYFGVFDGHAGWGAAVSAANQLHHIIHEKLCDVIELIIPDPNDERNLSGPLWSSEKNVSPESAVIGALEQAFWAMDQQIGEDRQRHHLSGGCTACIALFILGKVFVSNAGDSRGVIGLDSRPVPMSFDFTPETETQRIRKLGARHPELLGGEFTHLEFLRRPLRSDVGKKAPYRDHYMKGWGLKTITEADLKYPLVCGEGKRSRVLATIGVTRGFGDHDLRAQFSALPIKPFLSPEPEVRVFDLINTDVTDKDILILGTDGLWDIISNEKAVTIVCNSLNQFSPQDSHRYKYRYTSAAHDLVLWSRGRLREHQWRTSDDKHATIDDISAFVIPLRPFKVESVLENFLDYSEEVMVSSDIVAAPKEDKMMEVAPSLNGEEEEEGEEDFSSESLLESMEFSSSSADSAQHGDRDVPPPPPSSIQIDIPSTRSPDSDDKVVVDDDDSGGGGDAVTNNEKVSGSTSDSIVSPILAANSVADDVDSSISTSHQHTAVNSTIGLIDREDNYEDCDTDFIK